MDPSEKYQCAGAAIVDHLSQRTIAATQLTGRTYDHQAMARKRTRRYWAIWIVFVVVVVALVLWNWSSGSHSPCIFNVNC